MDESENEIANPNDRLSASDLELNHLNAVQLLDAQNVKTDCSRENCITEISNRPAKVLFDVDLKDVATLLKEKLHVTSNTNLLNGYSGHTEPKLNGLEGKSHEDIGYPDYCDIFRPGYKQDELSVLRTSNLCNSTEKSNSCHSVSLCRCASDKDCNSCSSINLPVDKSKADEIQPTNFIEDAERRLQSETLAAGVSCKSKCIKPSICNCKIVTNRKCLCVESEPSNLNNCICSQKVEKKIFDENSSSATNEEPIKYVGYESENQMPDIMRLIQKDLSEPYSIYTYRYFIHNWPKLCFLAMDGDKCVGAIVCKLDMHKKHSKRGYIAMLAVDENYRKRKIGSNLVLKAIRAMIKDEADEVVLETEITNKPALRLYENLGFVRDKRLFRYYLNGVDALRLKLWLR